MPDIHHLIDIAAPPATVYPLVSSATGLSQWWAEDIEATGLTGAIQLCFFNRSSIYRLELVTSEEGKRAVWYCGTGKEWQGTRIEFLLSAASTGTRLRFAHIGWQEATDYFRSCNTTWGVLMFHLKAAGEGLGHGPLFSRDGLAY